MCILNNNYIKTNLRGMIFFHFKSHFTLIYNLKIYNNIMTEDSIILSVQGEIKLELSLNNNKCG